MRRRWEALDMCMASGLICAVTPLNASKVKRTMNLWQFLFDSYFLIKGRRESTAKLLGGHG